MRLNLLSQQTQVYTTCEGEVVMVGVSLLVWISENLIFFNNLIFFVGDNFEFCFHFSDCSYGMIGNHPPRHLLEYPV